MNIRLTKRFVLLCLCMCGIHADEEPSQRRFEYQFSFKGPHLTQPDQTVPFWDLMGDVVPADDQVRLVPSIRDKKGLIWSKTPFPYESWEVEVHLRIEGRGKIGADGLAIWYTTSPAELGPVFGSKDYFTGVGVILDSFDNDNRMNNPYIYVVQNNGSQSFDHASDGIDQQSGGCARDFRNKPFPVRIKIQYSSPKLTVFYTSGNLADDEFQVCTTIENIRLPQNGYFGISAATGGLADDHDVLKFLTWSYQPLAEVSQDLKNEEREQLQKDYEKNLDDFNKLHEEYKKEHPDDAKTDRQLLYEGHTAPELTAIFEVQSDIKRDMRNLMENVAQIMNSQLSVQSSITAISSGTGTQTQAVPAGADDNAKKYHIDNVLNMQRENYDVVKEIRLTLQSLQGTVISLENALQQQTQRASSGVQAGGESYEAIKHRQESMQIMHTLQNDVNMLLNRQPPAPNLKCPDVEMPSCVPIAVFLVVAIIQIAILLAYHSVKSARENAAKKFY